MDEFHQDQLLIYMAFAQGRSSIKVGASITPHTKAAVYVLQSFMPGLKVEIQQENNANTISIVGNG